MDRSRVIKLVNTQYANDDLGIERASEILRPVYANVQTASASEFFSAGQNGIRAEYMFTILAAEYKGEKSVIYNGTRFAIYRTYARRNDLLELHVQREAGA